eukprot:5487130-Alexandrium_andersonii.AAC.1
MRWIARGEGARAQADVQRARARSRGRNAVQPCRPLGVAKPASLMGLPMAPRDTRRRSSRSPTADLHR